MADDNFVEIKVEGMTCTNCAQTVRRTLEKQGMQHINVDFASGSVLFENTPKADINQVMDSIDDLGYKVSDRGGSEKKILSHNRS